MKGASTLNDHKYMTAFRVPLPPLFLLTNHINLCLYVYMNEIIEVLKLLSDRQRVRILMLLSKKELSVCQLMGITGTSQPLVSRNLSLLYKGGFLDERRDGKLRFYSIRADLSDKRKDVLDLLRNSLRQSSSYKDDINTLQECSEFQKKAGSCSMKTLQEFMKWKKRRKKHS